MSVQRVIRNGKVRWKVQVRSGRAYVSGKTFDTRAEAIRWEQTEKAKLRDGYQPKLGRVAVGVFANEWLRWRANRVQPKTLTADRQAVGKLPTWMTKLELRAVTPRHIERWQDDLSRGLARSSVMRHREALSAMLARAAEEGRIAVNPVVKATAPVGVDELEKMRPFSTSELRGFADRVAEFDWRTAELVLILGWTGLRWGEARALTVYDYVRDGTPILRVSRSQPEGGKVKVTKSGKPRVVPIHDEADAILERLAYGKNRDDYLLTSSQGAQLWRTSLIRATKWDEIAAPRRIHDLRHTAITSWLSAGVPVHEVQRMAGHASITTTERYTHWMGAASAKSVRDRLSTAWSTPGAPENVDN